MSRRKPEPPWLVRNRRPAWQRGGFRLSDFDVLAPMHAALNKVWLAQQRAMDRMSATADRINRLEQAKAARERAARDERLRMHR